MRLVTLLALTCALVGLISTSAGAASVAYIDGHNLWLASPDGAQRFQVTTDGTADQPYSSPSQGADGQTVAARAKTLFLFGPDGKLVTANVMPVSAVKVVDKVSDLF